MSLRFKLPVIKAERVLGAEPLPDPFLGLPEELIMVTLLNLDPESLLNACSTSRTVRRACESEYFWRSKALRDFGHPEDYKPTFYESWKDYYLDRVFPERVFKQLVVEGNADAAMNFFKFPGIALLDLDLDPSKALLFVLERYDPKFDELIKYMLNDLSYRNFQVERDVGLGILCGLAEKSSYENFEVMGDLFLNQYTDATNDLDDVLRCAISGGNASIVSRTYDFYLHVNGMTVSGSLNPRARPERFIEYARSIDATPREIESIVQVLTKRYNSYESFAKSTMRRTIFNI